MSPLGRKLKSQTSVSTGQDAHIYIWLINGIGVCETCEGICPVFLSWNIKEVVNIPVY